MFRRFRQLLDRLFAPGWPDVDHGTAVLWEPCSKSHGEIIPGYAHILLELGYRVVVLMTPERLKEGLFSRFDDPGLVFAPLSQKQIARFMRMPAIHKAAIVLVTTAGKLPRRADKTTDLAAVFGQNVPANLLLVEHDAKDQIDAGSWNEKTITLRELDYRGRSSVVVNPNHFGKVRTVAEKKGKTVFLLVGASRSKRRNQDLVLTAARHLVTSGQTSFEIRLIGKRSRHSVPDELAGHIVDLGPVDFSRLYTEIENCCFILTAFQSENLAHLPYRTTKTTGSFQLCYGFRKPCIVQRDFIVGTRLNESNSILYGDDSEFLNALRTAMAMTHDEYATMQGAMTDAAQALHLVSLENMRTLIDELHSHPPVL